MAAPIDWSAPSPRVNLLDLIRVELLPLGMMPTCTLNGRTTRAIVVFDGLYVEGHGLYEDPSPAARAATGVSLNGWKYWKLPDGRALADLRQQYLSEH